MIEQERLAFGCGVTASPATAVLAANARVRRSGATAAAAVGGEEGHLVWAYRGLLAFTALLFFRPQDQMPALGALHLAELVAVGALGAMVLGRLRAGQAITRVTPELIGLVSFGALMLVTAPFSIWPGGAIGVFTDLYLKVLLISILLLNTLTTPRRLDRFTWLILVASSYIALRAVIDYLQGVNFVEDGRVRGAVGGMFRNPNDLALNMVAFTPLAVFMVLRPGPALRRLFAGTAAVLMLAAIVFTKSRSGFVGLALMLPVVGFYGLRIRPGLMLAFAMAGLLALPVVPQSFWTRMSSIVDADRDETGSRTARKELMKDAWATFLERPLTGVGAGQFENYNPSWRVERWRVAHNVVLQVAAELGAAGLAIFLFLIARAALAVRWTRKVVRPRRVRRDQSWARRPAADEHAAMDDSQRVFLRSHAAAVAAGLAGWFVCALFASVAFNWTFYYLLALAVAPREILRSSCSATLPAPLSGRKAA